MAAHGTATELMRHGEERPSRVEKTLWWMILQEGFWALWMEHNDRIFRREARTEDSLLAFLRGAVTGATLAVRTRSLKQILATATVVSAAATVTDYLAI